MQGRFSRFIKTSLLVGDLLALNLAFGLGYLYKSVRLDAVVQGEATDVSK